MNLVKTLADLKRKVASTTASVESELMDLRARVGAKEREVTTAENAPLPPDEVIAAFSRWVDETAAYQAREDSYGLIHGFGGPPGHTPNRQPFDYNTEMRWGFACLFLGDVLKASFARLVRTTEYQAGPAAAERGAVVARLREELRLIEAAEEEIVDHMRAGGLTIAHRPEVQQRRETEQRRRELEEQAARDRAAREAEINRQHDEARGRGRVARSEYLQRERGDG